MVIMVITPFWLSTDNVINTLTCYCEVVEGVLFHLALGLVLVAHKLSIRLELEVPRPPVLDELTCRKDKEKNYIHVRRHISWVHTVLLNLKIRSKT